MRDASAPRRVSPVHPVKDRWRPRSAQGRGISGYVFVHLSPFWENRSASAFPSGPAPTRPSPRLPQQHRSSPGTLVCVQRRLIPSAHGTASRAAHHKTGSKTVVNFRGTQTPRVSLTRAHHGRLNTGLTLVAHTDGVPVRDPYPDFVSSKLLRQTLQG